MSRVKVKICGVRRLEEARAAIACGADALGFNFWPRSPRYISPEDAAQIAAKLPPLVSLVGVFVNEQRQRIVETAERVGLHAIQLHGDEPPEFCRDFDHLKIIKALRVGENFDCRVLKTYPVAMILLDASVKGSYGGTGQSFDWHKAIEAKQYAPLILAGGLRADNIAEAIISVRPAAVDVCSGVEAEPGRKDLRRLRELMKEVEAANAKLAVESA